jgi:hypothetical protein
MRKISNPTRMIDIQVRRNDPTDILWLIPQRTDLMNRRFLHHALKTKHIPKESQTTGTLDIMGANPRVHQQQPIPCVNQPTMTNDVIRKHRTNQLSTNRAHRPTIEMVYMHPTLLTQKHAKPKTTLRLRTIRRQDTKMPTRVQRILRDVTKEKRDGKRGRLGDGLVYESLLLKQLLFEKGCLLCSFLKSFVDHVLDFRTALSTLWLDTKRSVNLLGCHRTTINALVDLLLIDGATDTNNHSITS